VYEDIISTDEVFRVTGAEPSLMENPMSESGTKSLRKPLRFWGWGYADEDLRPEEHAMIDTVTQMFVPEGLVEVKPPSVDDFELPASRLSSVPTHLSDIVSITTYDRLVHSYGKSYADMARMLMREVPNPPDAIAFPRTEDDIQQLFRYASENNIALIPFGGGTSVCGGVEPDVGSTYQATISVDMENLNQILEIDSVSRRARIQAGIKGPDLERQLKQHGWSRQKASSRPARCPGQARYLRQTA
jgi:alkyldihydroxyacetonephosphate synthase